MRNTAKIDQLTSLRFFAALMIVFHHAEGLFGPVRSPLNLGQGVSFFFVLSGFILTYVYPVLDSGAEMRRFWLARFARIWPAYLATFVFAFALLPFQWSAKTGVAHLAMVQAWLPMSLFYFSYNAAAWSISTEAFFYVVFPFLVRNWARTWALKLAGTICVFVVLVTITTWIGLPDYGNPYHGSDGLMVTMHGMIYVNPLARMLEFVTGMVLAQLWSAARQVGMRWTVVEVGTVGLCVAAMYYTQQYVEPVRGKFGDAAAMWVMHSGSFLAFAALIHVIARGGGAISRVLQWRPFVVLGEISFSMYLLHQTLFSVWRSKASALGNVPTWAAIGFYFVVLIGLSYLVWIFIEIPARRRILAAHPSRWLRRAKTDRIGALPEKAKPNSGPV
jgi:peptidoglycan/LPS O-acetylase OafA/YrhL